MEKRSPVAYAPRAALRFALGYLRFFHSKQVDPHQELLTWFLNFANFAPLR
jgi:hypothetical protein